MHESSDQAAVIQLQKQHKLSQYLILATVISTVVNIALLLGNSSFAIPYSASLAYNLTLLGFFFDGYTLGTYTATGMVMAFVLLSLWLVVWYLAKRRWVWLLVGLIFVAMDGVCMVIFALLFLENPAGCLLDGIFHLVVIFEIAVGLRACRQLAKIQNHPAAEAPMDSFP